jgi:hypothetical protein
MDEPTRLANDWIAYWEHEFRTGKFPPSSHTDDLDEAVYDKPEIASNPDWVKLVEVLAAGPVEDLLREHGPAVIDRVEAEARRNPAFNNVLGVYGPAVSIRRFGSGSRRCATRCGENAA